MVKHTVFDHFVGLVLKGLRSCFHCNFGHLFPAFTVFLHAFYLVEVRYLYKMISSF